MSHVKHIKTIQAVTRDKVKAMLGWDDLKYNQFQYQQGEAYLLHHIGADAWGVNQIQQSPGFWAWWRNHWHKRDVDFADEAKGLNADERLAYYEITHAIEAIEYTPHSAIMAHTFANEVINPLCGRKLPKERKVKI